jgi:uncharacterized protein YneF (UPF0154 family)
MMLYVWIILTLVAVPTGIALGLWLAELTNKATSCEPSK